MPNQRYGTPDCDNPRDTIVHPRIDNDGFVGEGVRHHGEEDKRYYRCPRRGWKHLVGHLKQIKNEVFRFF